MASRIVSQVFFPGGLATRLLYHSVSCPLPAGARHPRTQECDTAATTPCRIPARRHRNGGSRFGSANCARVRASYRAGFSGGLTSMLVAKFVEPSFLYCTVTCDPVMVASPAAPLWDPVILVWLS